MLFRSRCSEDAQCDRCPRFGRCERKDGLTDRRTSVLCALMVERGSAGYGLNKDASCNND